jgi:hypothetical protein
MYGQKFGGGYRHQRVVQLMKNKVEAREGCRIFPTTTFRAAGWSPNFGEFGLPVTSSATWKHASIFVSLYFVALCFGGPGEIRTHDLFHAMEARSQLRHRPNRG